VSSPYRTPEPPAPRTRGPRVFSFRCLIFGHQMVLEVECFACVRVAHGRENSTCANVVGVLKTHESATISSHKGDTRMDPVANRDGAAELRRMLKTNLTEEQRNEYEEAIKELDEAYEEWRRRGGFESAGDSH